MQDDVAGVRILGGVIAEFEAVNARALGFQPGAEFQAEAAWVVPSGFAELRSGTVEDAGGESLA